MGKQSGLVTALAVLVALASPLTLRNCDWKNNSPSETSQVTFNSSKYDARLIRAIHEDINNPEYPATILNDSTYVYSKEPQTQYKLGIEDRGYDDNGNRYYSVNFEATSSKYMYSLPSDTTQPAVRYIL